MRTGYLAAAFLSGLAHAQIDVTDDQLANADVFASRPVLRAGAVETAVVGDATALADRLGRLQRVEQDFVFELDGTPVMARLRPIRDEGSHSFAMAGALVDEAMSQVLVTVERGVVHTSVVSPTRGSYRVCTNPQGGAGYVLCRVTPPNGASCGEPEVRRDRSPEPRFSTAASANTLRGGACMEDGSQIDVLVVYTPGAVTLAGGQAAMDTLVQASIDEMNLAMTNSLVATQVNLVWSEEVSYATSGGFSTDLARLRDPADGHMDGVHQLRDDLKADLVCLISEPGDVCGIAYISVLTGGTPNEDLGFSVVNVNCATAPTSAFAHELGHNLGVRHDWQYHQCANGATKYAKGHVEPGAAFQTVVASNGATPRILHFSNPNVDFVGQPTGVAEGMTDPADAARSIGEVAVEVARYRSRDCNSNGVCDDDDILNATSFDCNGNGYPDECERDWNNNGVPDDCDIASATSLDADLDGVPDEIELTRFYVDQNAVGAETGTGWADARTDLQEVLAIAEASGDVTEIWVAAGTYTPSAFGHRDRPFDIPPGVSMYGGFAGTETTLGERDIAANPTILSGDLNNDDATGMVNRGDNSVHAVYMWEAGTLDFDGFTVTGGMAEFPPNCNLDNYGGGMFVFGTDVTIRNCTFTENAGVYGGALSVVQNSTGKIIGCDFISNDAISTPQSASGAAMYFSNGPLPGSDPVVVNCRVIGNRSDGSGVVSNIGGQPEYYNCQFSGNRSFWIAAAMNNSSANGSDAIITGCTFVDNATGYAFYGGAIENFRSDPVFTNTILWNNRNANGSTEGTQLYNTGGSVPIVNYSIVEGWSGTMMGVGSFDAEPLFVDELGADLVAGTTDDDLRLAQGSPAIDAGDSDALPADTVDLDNDADTSETLPLDLDGNARLIDDTAPDNGVGSFAYLDLGAYERDAGTPACSPADVTTTGAGAGDPGFGVPDGQITAGDLQYYVNLWVGADLGADVTTTGAGAGDPGFGVPDGQVTAGDLQYYVNLWIAGCP